MSKKRDPVILVIIGLIFIFGTIVTIKQVAAFRVERSQMIEVCRDALLDAYGSEDRPGYASYTCGDTTFYSPIKYVESNWSLLSANIYFTDGPNRIWCNMRWDGSEWEITGTPTTIASMCP